MEKYGFIDAICAAQIPAETSQRWDSETDYWVVIRILRWLNIFLKKHPVLPSQSSLKSSAVEAAGCGENAITKLCSHLNTFISLTAQSDQTICENPL